MSAGSDQPGKLRLVHNSVKGHGESVWFCGRCAARSTAAPAPPPSMRVCPACGLGLLLEAAVDLAPKAEEPFVVLDTTLAIEAVSARAEELLGITEQQELHRPVRDLLDPAEVDSACQQELMRALAEVAAGSDQTRTVFIRPHNIFGVRWRARIGSCGPPRGVLIVFDPPRTELRGL